MDIVARTPIDLIWTWSSDEPDDRRRTFHLDVELPDTAPFDVELTMPVHRCARCGHEQVHSLKEVRSRTPAALAHAFKSAEIAAG